MSHPRVVPSPPADTDDDGVLAAEAEQLQRSARRMAAGGWRRALVGMAVGAAAGLAAALAVSGDRRR